MKPTKFILVILCLFLNTTYAQTDFDFQNSNLPLDTRVNDLLNRLTIQEKISLLQSTSEAITRLKIDKYYHGNEGLHGVVKGGRFTVFPQAIALAATWNPDLIYETASAISDEARAKWNFYNQGKDQKGILAMIYSASSITIS